MAHRVLLISPNLCQTPYPVFPLGLGYIDAALRAAGHATLWMDLQIETRRVEQVIHEFGPNFIGISVRNIDDVVSVSHESYIDGLPDLVTRVRSISNAPIVLGGSGYSVLPRELLAFTSADYGIQGAGERAFVELIAQLQRGEAKPSVPGLVFRSKNGIVELPACHVPDGALPSPHRPHDILQFYIRKKSPLNIQTQRGCPLRCCYCAYPLIEGRSSRRFEPETVVEDFIALKESGAEYAFIVDSVFNSSSEHVVSICEALIASGVRLDWGCFLRPLGLNSTLMNLMARAGLHHIEFGSDSFSDQVLEQYGKSFDFDEILKSSKLAHEANIDFCHFLVCGGPGESAKTLEESFDNSLRLPGGVVLALPGMRIYPGTPLHNLAREEGVISSSTNLLQPRYYRSPLITEEELSKFLSEFAQRSSKWLMVDPAPGYKELMERLRTRGMVGPTWSYVAALQRLIGPLFSPFNNETKNSSPSSTARML